MIKRGEGQTTHNRVFIFSCGLGGERGVHR